MKRTMYVLCLIGMLVGMGMGQTPSYAPLGAVPGSTKGSIATAIANGTYYPLQYTGTDVCVQIQAAVNALPSTGGTINLQLGTASPASCSVNPWAALGSKPVNFIWGPGKIDTTAQWYVHSNFFHMQGAGMGNSQLIYTGTTALKDPGGVNPGGVLELDSPTPATVYNYGDSVSDMAIVGNSYSPYAMLVDGTHHSQFRNLSLWGSATCDYESKFAVVDNLDNIHSSSGDASFFGLPGTSSPNGLCFDGEDASHETTAATVTDPLSEGHATSGIEISNAQNMTFEGGTSEANGTSGSTATANLVNGGFKITISGLDMEGAANLDILDTGASNIYSNVLGATASSFKGNQTDINYGQVEGIAVAAPAVDVQINAVRAANTPTDSGTGTYGAYFNEGLGYLVPLNRTLPNTSVNPYVSTQFGQAPGGLIVNPNASTTAPTYLENSGLALLEWDYSGSFGEIDLFSNRQAGSGGGVSFYDIGNTGTVTHLLDVFPTQVTARVGFTAPSYGTLTNCSSAGNPAVCGSSASGSVAVAAAATTVVVDTTAVTANSQIQLTFDSSLGSRLGVTCNTTYAAPQVTARAAGTSFTVTVGAAPATNPACYSYTIFN